MALSNKVLPFGMRQCKITPLGADGATPGTAVLLPSSRRMSFSDTEDYTDLQGDDTIQATHGSGPSVDWTLEEGGISLEAYVLIAGGTVTTSGISPNAIKTFSKDADTSRPYFRAEGRSVSDNGGDFHVVLYRCKATANIEGEMNQGAFWITNCSGKAFGSLEVADLGKLYDFVNNETDDPLTAP